MVTSPTRLSTSHRILGPVARRMAGINASANCAAPLIFLITFSINSRPFRMLSLSNESDLHNYCNELSPSGDGTTGFNTQDLP